LLFAKSFAFNSPTSRAAFKRGDFGLSNATIIQADTTLFEAQYLQQAIKEQTGLELKILPVAGQVSKICFSRSLTSTAAKDSYALSINKENIAITSDEDEGFFYGVQTLLQLIPQGNKGVIKLSCLKIEDAPKFSWRGMHLDCARHFFRSPLSKNILIT